MAAVAIKMLSFDGSILKIDATAQFLHIDEDRPIAARIDPHVPELYWNAHAIGSEKDKLLMRKGKRTWYKIHAEQSV